MNGATMVVKLKQIFDKFSIIQNILAYITEDEGSILQTCVQAYK